MGIGEDNGVLRGLRKCIRAEIESVTLKETDMKRSGFTEEQIFGILREQDARMNTVDVCR